MGETKHRVGTREEWQAERAELAKLEAEQSQRNEEVVKRRRDLPWVPVEKEYRLDAEDGKKSLAELFDGRSQLLAYNIMFGPDYRIGACPGCTSLADGLDGTLVHLNHSDVSLVWMSAGADRAAGRVQAPDGLAVPIRLHVRVGLRLRLRPCGDRRTGAAEPGAQGVDRRPSRVASRVGGQHRGRAEGRFARDPSWIAFALENGTVYHTYTVSAPDPFVAPYFGFMLERTPTGGPPGADIRRKDEYPD